MSEEDVDAPDAGGCPSMSDCEVLVPLGCVTSGDTEGLEGQPG